MQTTINNNVAFSLTGTAIAPDLVGFSLVTTLSLPTSLSATDGDMVICNAVTAAQDYIDNLGVDQQLVINEIATRIFGAPLPGLSMWVSPTSRSRRSLSGARGTMGRAIAGFLLGNYYPGDRRTDRPSKCMTAGDYFERIRPRCF